jgi:hypothetical protein
MVVARIVGVVAMVVAMMIAVVAMMVAVAVPGCGWDHAADGDCAITLRVAAIFPNVRMTRSSFLILSSSDDALVALNTA